MPYITATSRPRLEHQIAHIIPLIRGCGELNYVIIRLIDAYSKPHHYASFNEVIGVLECVKQEFYRRRVADYEDTACFRNGDVF